MDYSWAAEQLREFIDLIDDFVYVGGASGNKLKKQEEELFKQRAGEVGKDRWTLHDELVRLEPVMRKLMNVAQPELGNYSGSHEYSGSYIEMSWSPGYWPGIVKPCAVRAQGIHSFAEEARIRLQPDGPTVRADQLHQWVWSAAIPLWEAGNVQEAVQAAARSVNARLQQKAGRHDVSEAALVREAFSLNPPEPGHPRLRFSGDRLTDTWKSRQQGALNFGVGCFQGIRNPAAHVHELDLPEHVAVEQLAALSLLARWIEECLVESAE